MSLTLGLSTAISGMLTSQRGLDVVAQNVSNTNTVGYTRKTMNQEARVLNGSGAGVQVGSITRDIDEGLLKSLRRETSKLKQYEATDTYYQRLNQLFGPPADNTSISHSVTALADSIETLAGQVTKQTSYLGAVQSAKDLTDRLNDVSWQIQQLRADADQRIGDVVALVNEQLSAVENLNNLITKNIATGSGVQDLQDRRDQALTTLSGFMEISYYSNSDGSLTVFSGSNMLVDRHATVLSHTTVNTYTAESSGSDGTVDGIWMDGRDISREIHGGELGALLDVRDTMLSDVQAGLDRLAAVMTSQVNSASNRGTSFPTATSTMTGTRRFADQANVTQRIQFGGATDDVYLNLFDSDGAQIAGLNLDGIMTANYAAVAVPAANPDYDPKASRGSWSIDEVAAHIQGWLRTEGYTTATAGMNSDGQMVIDVGDSSVTLAFRDQVSGTAGATAADATINFDVDGDGNSDKPVMGFSNFFGLGDVFESGRPNHIQESAIQSAGARTSVARTIAIYDPSGKLGSSISLPVNSTLESIAAAINKMTVTYDSGLLSSTYTVPAALNGQTLTISGPASVVGTYTATTGDTLADIATALTGMGLTASVIQDGTGSRLRFSDPTGQELSLSGTVATDLDIQQQQRAKASVVAEGSGYRLRVAQTNHSELFIAATPDVSGNSFLTDLGMSSGLTGASGVISVRSTLLEAPHTVPRGAVQFNSNNGTYFIDEGDNTTALQMVAALKDKVAITQTGKLGAGSFNMSEYGATVVGMAAREADANKGQFSYQVKLAENIQTQYDGQSGVNMDEEMTKMISYQQTYAATAKVITTLQEMLEVLTSMIR